jgi:hypothetical protein
MSIAVMRPKVESALAADPDLRALKVKAGKVIHFAMQTLMDSG